MSQLVVPHDERRDMIRRFHDSLFAGHLGVSRTVFHLQSRVFASGCANVSGILYYMYMSGTKISVSAAGTNGACRSGPSLGSCGNGFVGLIDYVSQGKSICVGDGGLFLLMDGGLSTSGQEQDRVVHGGRFLPVCCVSLRNAWCYSFGSRPGIRE